MTTPSVRSVFQVLKKQRVMEIARDLGVVLPPTLTQEAQIEALLRHDKILLPDLLPALGRDELKKACRDHQLDDDGRSRAELSTRLLQSAQPGAPWPAPTEAAAPRLYPRGGDIVQVRHRQYLVSEVRPSPDPTQMTRISLVCLDDDAQGRVVEVLWELELGARILQPETHGLGEVRRLDPPREFAAYFHALKWNRVTATDSQLFQAPFRAGIMLKDYQLTPLMKALELPRANLFIADDVGLGKTIEAGLVLQELLLRQRTDWVLIICPASVSLQWRGEMERRFGLRFEIYNRDFVARRRQERGFGINPWSTHNRFIISYQTFRRPEYRDPLLQLLGERKKKSLLLHDEAHTAAPASASKYAVDSSVTRTIRDAAPRFENRLFLSATPHNGHSNSFSALLEILDKQRFMRGTQVAGPEQLHPVMVRRLKSDLLALNYTGFPIRHVVQIDVGADAGANDATPSPEPPEIELSRLLAEYTALCSPRRGAGRLVFITLQKRLLSSIEAFARTLEKHAERVGDAIPAQLDLSAPPEDLSRAGDPDDDEIGPDAEAAEDARVGDASRHLAPVTGSAQTQLARMRELAQRHRNVADAKVKAIIAWIRENQCPSVALGGAQPKDAAQARWTDRRVILFTEYGHTKSYLRRILSTAVENTDQGEERIQVFDGGMSEENRDLLQQAWNGPPDEYPVRILIATDAAREGVNLQGHCADLFHFDIPWNPARMEQRNGRIDRTLQEAKEVRCMYFFYPQRTEDQVLRALVRKVGRITSELGSLGTVVLDRLTLALDRGIDPTTLHQLDEAEQMGLFRPIVERELESQRPQAASLAAEILKAQRILNKSRELMEFRPEHLRDAIDVGLSWAGAGPLQKAASPAREPYLFAFALPEMKKSWETTLDTLRPPRKRDEDFSDWRKRPPLPVVFQPPEKISTPVSHLHLQHPFVQRILARFLSQGHSAHDLSRVTVLLNPKDSIVRVLAFGRLSLFGTGATRLHDQLVSVAAAVLDQDGGRDLCPFAEEADRRALERLEELLSQGQDLARIDARVQERLCRQAPGHFATLWRPIEEEADAVAHEAERKLRLRGEAEAEALRKLLLTQQNLAESTLRNQLLFEFAASEAPQMEQLKQDRKYLAERQLDLKKEIEQEPKDILDSYQVVRRRLEPVGLVYLWPGTR